MAKKSWKRYTLVLILDTHAQHDPPFDGVTWVYNFTQGILERENKLKFM